MEKHEWREREEEGLVYFKATYHAGRWNLYRQPKNAEDWDEIVPIPREHWEKIRDILWRKYQRKRGTYKFIEEIDKRLAAEDEETA
jgi:hypothetical protein